MKLKLTIIATLGIAAMLTACASAPKEATTTLEMTTAADETPTEATSVEEGTLHNVAIQVKDYGTIFVELDSTYAPITVENFLKLSREGFYDGLTFHRIMDGFMIQGGDPDGTGMGGAPDNVKGEFKKNGVENPLSHKRGAISMARSNSMDSASSQFFIVQSDSTFLDGDYAAFGQVTEGMELVDQICKDTAVQDGNGTVKAENQPVIEKIEVLD